LGGGVTTANSGNFSPGGGGEREEPHEKSMITESCKREQEKEILTRGGFKKKFESRGKEKKDPPIGWRGRGNKFISVESFRRKDKGLLRLLVRTYAAARGKEQRLFGV